MITGVHAEPLPVSVVIPTYRRERVLLDTLEFLLKADPPPFEILVIDQTEVHAKATECSLAAWDEEGRIRWIRLPRPSISRAMNAGLEYSRAAIVLFLDDDIIPGQDLLSAHVAAHAGGDCHIVAGQVLQPGESVSCGGADDAELRFNSANRRWANEFMGGNFSVNRGVALGLGGFDENFVHVAYRFEAEFASRALSAGERILFEPAASIRHLKAPVGGTRAYGNHLTTVRPSHAVGAYYYLLRARNLQNRFAGILSRMFRSVRTRHHLNHPWWIPGTLAAELLGLIWACVLFLRGPRLIEPVARPRGKHD